MLRKLLIICCLFSTNTLFAQQEAHPAPGRGVNLRQTNPPIPPPPPMDPNNPHGLVNYTSMPDNPGEFKVVGAPLPDFIVRTVEGKNITNKDFQYQGNLFVMLFNPTCGHCEDMTDMLGKNISLFSKSKILMVATPQQQPYLRDFQNRHHIKEYEPITVGLDSTKLVDRLFLYKLLPQINIYGSDRKLIKILYGEVPMDSLKAYIQ